MPDYSILYSWYNIILWADKSYIIAFLISFNVHHGWAGKKKVELILFICDCAILLLYTDTTCNGHYLSVFIYSLPLHWQNSIIYVTIKRIIIIIPTAEGHISIGRLRVKDISFSKQKVWSHVYSESRILLSTVIYYEGSCYWIYSCACINAWGCNTKSLPREFLPYPKGCPPPPRGCPCSTLRKAPSFMSGSIHKMSYQ